MFFTSKKKLFLKILIIFLIIYFLSLSVYLIFFVKINVKGNSMLPYLKNNQNFLGLKYFQLEKDQNVVAEVNGINIVKKIIGLEEDKIIFKNGKIFRNGSDISNFFINTDNELNLEIFVPKNKIFLLGTNLKESEDSRHFGFVDYKKIKYLLLFKI